MWISTLNYVRYFVSDNPLFRVGLKVKILLSKKISPNELVYKRNLGQPRFTSGCFLCPFLSPVPTGPATF